jgi:Cu/Ag efflux protein CusF
MTTLIFISCKFTATNRTSSEQGTFCWFCRWPIRARLDQGPRFDVVIVMKFIAAFALLALSASCNKFLPVDVGQGQGHGLVLRVDTVHSQVTIDHEEIPNLIEGMTFSYPVKDRSLLRGLHPLDSVTFTLKETSPGNFEVEAIHVESHPKS